MALPFPDNPYGFSTNVAINACNAQVAQQLGMSFVRRVFNWSNLEPTEGSFDGPTLAQLDSDVQTAYSYGLNFTFVVSQPPSWATTIFHNGCVNIVDTKELGLAQYLLNRYNGGTVPNAKIARWSIGNEGYDDTGGPPCNSFENAVPVLQAVYPWIKSNYPDVLIGTPAHFNLQQTNIQSVQSSLYTGFYGNAKGLWDFNDFHWYGTVRNNNLYTGPDGNQGVGHDTFNQCWQDIHAIDVANGNGSIPLYCTETGIAVPGASNQNTEVDHACFFVGGQGLTGVYQDCINSGGVVTHLGAWTIQNSNGYSFTQGCATLTYKPVYYAVRSFIAANPDWSVNTLTASKAALFVL